MIKQFEINGLNINKMFKLVTAPGYEIGAAKVKTNIQELPAADGELDLTETLAGEPLYGSRDFSATFSLLGKREEWQKNITRLRSALHGRKCKMFEPDDADYYYVGRFDVGPLEYDVISTLQITATLEPYKFKKDLTIKEYTLGTGSLTMDIPNGRKSVIPIITVDNTTQLIFNDKSISLTAGTHRNSNIIFRQGDNKITMNSVAWAKVKFEYREGEL